jgi:hypothetical protein
MNSFVALTVHAAYVTAEVPITRDNVKPGWVALGIVFALGVGLFFLLRSFAKHARVARQPWDGEDASSDGSRG